MSTGNGMTHGYYVEVRAIAGVDIQKLPGNFVVAQEWKRLPVHSALEVGVPRRLYCPVAEAVTDLVSFAAAHALMAWAAASVDLDGVGLEFRLVEAEFTYSWAVKEVAHGEPISFLERHRKEFPHG